jgi:hypothetical protein
MFIPCDRESIICDDEDICVCTGTAATDTQDDRERAPQPREAEPPAKPSKPVTEKPERPTGPEPEKEWDHLGDGEKYVEGVHNPKFRPEDDE